MRKLVGVPASPGIAVGLAHLFGFGVEVRERHVGADEIDEELRRLDRALAVSDGQLERIQKQIAAQEAGEHQFGILEAHRLMLMDPHLVDEARKLIRQDASSAEWAVRSTLDRIQAVFERIEDPYFRERRSDVASVGHRLLSNLLGLAQEGVDQIPKGGVVYGHDLSPADVTQLGRAGVGGLFTETGGRTSHTAVVSRALALPYVVGIPSVADHVRPGMQVIVDGNRGEVILEPDAGALALYEARAARDLARAHRLAESHQSPAVTLDGTRIHLAANVELLEEVPTSVELGAESIGLFRTEFLYLERSTLPTEEEHFEHAVAALKTLQGRQATFRTLDLGGDKLPLSIRMPAGSNPALGLRSIRFSLAQRDLFKAQLRALYRAAALAPLRILFPMISGVGELRAVKAICQEVCEELRAGGVSHNPLAPLGVMIETPSAALTVDLLARECDFLSVGTNDLIQYALAADRQDEHVGYLYHPLHPAILRILRQIVAGARLAGKPVAMCGDMAGDPMFVWVLLGIGLRDLSMAPRQIPLVKSIIRSTRLADAEALVATAEGLATETEVEDLVTRAMEGQFPVELDVGEVDPQVAAGPA